MSVTEINFEVLERTKHDGTKEPYQAIKLSNDEGRQVVVREMTEDDHKKYGTQLQKWKDKQEEDKEIAEMVAAHLAKKARARIEEKAKAAKK